MGYTLNIYHFIACARVLEYRNMTKEGFQYTLKGLDNLDVVMDRLGGYVEKCTNDTAVKFGINRQDVLTASKPTKMDIYYTLMLSPYYRYSGMKELESIIKEMDMTDDCIAKLKEFIDYLYTNFFQDREIYDALFYYNIFILLLSGKKKDALFQLREAAKASEVFGSFYPLKNMNLRYLRWAMFGLHSYSLFTLKDIVTFYGKIDLDSIGPLDIEMIITALSKASPEDFEKAVEPKEVAAKVLYYFFKNQGKDKVYSDRLLRVFEKNKNKKHIIEFTTKAVSGK